MVFHCSCVIDALGPGSPLRNNLLPLQKSLLESMLFIDFHRFWILMVFRGSGVMDALGPGAPEETTSGPLVTFARIYAFIGFL